MSNLFVRAITGALFVLLVLGSIFWHETAAYIVLTGFMLLGLIEFYSLFKGHESIDVNWKGGLILGISAYGLLSASMFGHIPTVFSLLVIPLAFTVLLFELWRKKENPIINTSILLFGATYLVVPFFLTIMLNHLDESISWFDGRLERFPLIAGMFILVWTNDTFAYLSGRLMGKTKLFERISPKKTWEGTVSGIIFTIGISFLISYGTENEDLLFWLVSGALISVSAILGDLMESLFKRSLKVKDSGTILPGHGGILDRFDAMLFAAPFFVVWTYINFYLA